jgi:hypothetical protein
MVYVSPLAAASSCDNGLTHYRAFIGKDAALNIPKSLDLIRIADGTSDTLLVVEADEGVPWTKPDDFVYDAKKPLPKLKGLSSAGFAVLFADGSVRMMSSSIPEKTLRAYITANGGELIHEREETPKGRPQNRESPRRANSEF